MAKAGSKITQEENGRWKQVISYRDVDTGKLKQTTLRGLTEKEVKAKNKEFYKAIDAGIKPNAGSITLADWLDKWLEVYKKIVWK